MKVYRNSVLQTLVHLLTFLATKYKIATCETPVANNFGAIPEYGHPTASNTKSTDPPFDLSSTSLETLSSTSDPQYEENYQDYNSLENDYHDYDAYEDPFREDAKDASSEEPSNHRKNKGRGFEDESSSSLMKFLMSPLKPFSLIPSVFRKVTKFRRKKKGGRRYRDRGRHRGPKGRGEIHESEASSELRGVRDDEDEFDLHVDSSESSAGYRRKKRGRGRGWRLGRWWRGKGRRKSKRRRKPKKVRSRPKHRPRRPHHDDDYEVDDYKKIPIKVTYDSDLSPHQNSFNNGLESDNQPYNNKPDHHKPSEKEETGTRTLASFLKNNFKNGFDMMKESMGRTQEEGRGKFHKEHNGTPGPFWNFGSQPQSFESFPKSIYDKLPPVPGIKIFPSTNPRPYTPYIAPPNHPMRIMRPPIPPRLPPFFSSDNPNSYHFIAANNGSSNNANSPVNVVKNDDFGTPSASFNFPEFPPPTAPRGLRPTPDIQFRPVQDETVPPPYMSVPRPLPFPPKFSIVPRRPPGVVRYLRGIGTRVRYPVGMRAPMHYLHHQRLIPIQLERGYARTESNFNQIPSFSSPSASFSNWHHHHLPLPQRNDFTKPEQELSQNDAEEKEQEKEHEDQPMESGQLEIESAEIIDNVSNTMTEQFTKVTPQIIYGKWNPLLDKVDDDASNNELQEDLRQ